ncbi:MULTISPECIES: hypothetical protein [unclassified Rhizobium]|uniref:hypothetical protein n=1 Tax=unclassified Rhizobium TaxID=2613769 RepID=UPI001A983371|nr:MULTISPECIES: hypothetical protein [unclassified Rhizobium]MBX5155641.1 hypothetical protein [Rhizobium sp. NZLR8]MBX5167361.1 hypothetical protein [Rhizobium sp. NZLR4b]MBX5171697.1 hypothetical protein [Rhizobium sp. NZLR1b]MBX5185867.1 hypothetical protein [Rhizobium sp. NZLR5]MBX5191353.1 hypothetical protein [Rhizobium sp. NZLR3b]
MKSDFGESMIWLAGIAAGGDGSPQRSPDPADAFNLDAAEPGQIFACPAKTKLSPVFRRYFSYCRTHQ